MSADDKFEDDLLFAISRTGDAFQADQTPLLAGGLQRGRRRWRRRSAAAVAGGATALALVATGGVYLAGLGGPQGNAVTVAPAGVTGGSTPSAPTATPSAGAPTTAAVSGDEMAALLKGLLPPGTSTVASSRGSEGKENEPPAAPAVSLVFDDGHGKAAIGLVVQRYAPGDASLLEQAQCPDPKFRVADSSCTTTTLGDGSTLTVLQGYEYPDRRVDTRAWSATLAGKDGRLVQLQEWNSPQEKGAPISRPAPPLSPEQLRAVVTDRSWDRVVAALTAPKPRQSQDTGKEYSAQEILAIAAKLLPAGLTETETDGQPGYANFVLNDGRGKSMVEINVQDWSPKPGKDKQDDGMASHFAAGRTLPDGTKVVVQKFAGNPARWTVDALRPDGLRVVIGAYNSGGPRQPAVRTAPVLNDAQLEAVVTSPLWQLRK
ncbi:hypothetical protein [Kitasatospora sp. NPDC057015]|uniref:hypothetical protein n=1 Tax=Kitasatospora sp. NPDC057015 TaxID=3346001 RepID=UPI0036407D00